MQLWQKLLLTALVAALTAGMILTWGSIGSGILAFCLLATGGSLLYQHFLTNHDDDSWDTE